MFIDRTPVQMTGKGRGGRAVKLELPAITKDSAFIYWAASATKRAMGHPKGSEYYSSFTFTGWP